MKSLGDSTIDSIVSDPPYGLEFMGKDWDAPWKSQGTVLDDPAEVGGFQDGQGGNPYSRSRIRYGFDGDASTGFQQWFTPIARECFRVLRPGGYMLAFGGSRTYHRLACAVEDAGFDVVGEYHWLYGSGFPKSLDVAKAMDKADGNHRGKAGAVVSDNGSMVAGNYERTAKGEPISLDAQKWSGWGTALKPSHEPLVIARKPSDKDFSVNTENSFSERFFYCPKPAVSERDAGLEDLVLNEAPGVLQMRQPGHALDGQVTAARKNFHPTVKPLELMRHLISLVTPEDGIVLDPFLGSGTTACAAILDGFHWTGCELTEDYWPLIEARVAWAEEEREWILINGTQLSLFDGL